MPVATTTRQARLDRASIKLDATKTAEGYLVGEALMSACGVFPYEYPDGTVLMELRHPDDVYQEDSLASFCGIPITIEHPRQMLDASNAQGLSVGVTGDDCWAAAPYVKGCVKIIDAKGVRSIESGDTPELSFGYFADLVFEPGIYNGMRYDARQTNIRGNHLALTKKARLGSELRIQMDSAFAIRSDKPATARTDSQTQESAMPLVKVYINKVAYDAAQEVANEIERLQTALETEQADRTKDKAAHDAAMVKQVTAGDSLKAERDGIQAKLDTATAEVAKIPEKVKTLVADGVKSRVSLERVAAKVLPAEEFAKLDGKADLDIKKAVILVLAPKAKLDSETEAYIETRFKIATENLDEDIQDNAIADSRLAVAPRNDGTSRTPVNDARARMKERLQNGGKTLAELKNK